MIAKRNGWGARTLPELRNFGHQFGILRDQLFPEFQVLFRRGGKVTYINVTPMRQAVGMGVVVCLIAAMVYVGARFQHFGHVVSMRSDALATAQRDRATMSDELGALRDALAEAEGRASAVGDDNDRLASALSDAQKRIEALEGERGKLLAEAQKRLENLDAERAKLDADRADIERKLAAAEDKLNARNSNSQQLAKELERDREQLRHSDSNQATLQTRIQTLEQQLAKANSSTDQYKNDLSNISKKLQDLASERDRLMAQRKGDDSRAAQMATNENRRPVNGGSVAIDTPAPPPSSSSSSSAVEPEPSPQALANFTPAPIPAMQGSVESLLASAGLDVGKLLDEIGGSRTGEGGPFLSVGDAAKKELDAQRAKQLQKLYALLPLAAPLDSYRFESPFGVRADPINHRKAYHTGVDLSAPYRTHVMSTAAGIVVFAGADGEYGRAVEIDHGHGIVTRYAHLHRTLVVKGQKVPAHFAVGELGSTGRSTGPHVHYEVVVDGTPLDPAKFIGAGKNVLQTGSN